MFLQDRADDLGRRGWFYPDTGEDYRRTGIFPKHRWVLEALMAGDPGPFERRLDEVLRRCPPGAHTMILSDEALYGDWPHVSAAGRAALSALKSRFDVQLWIWFREPVSYARSQYIQMLKNPRGPAPGNGLDLPIDEALALPWFVSRLDYIGFVRDLETVLGPGQVRPFAYDGYTIRAFLQAAGLSDIDCGQPRENVTIGWAGVRLLRALNHLPLDAEAKVKATRLVAKLDALVATAPLTLSAATGARIARLTGPSVEALARDYGVFLRSGETVPLAGADRLRAA